MTKKTELIKKVVEVLNENLSNENGYQPSHYVACHIEDIMMTPVNDLRPMDIYYLFDTLGEVLISEGLISDDNSTAPKGQIDVSNCDENDIEFILNGIVGELFTILDENGLMD